MSRPTRTTLVVTVVAALVVMAGAFFYGRSAGERHAPGLAVEPVERIDRPAIGPQIPVPTPIKIPCKASEMTDFAPVGDPEAMRATARALIAQADGIGLAPEGAVAALEALVLEGPAAARLRAAAGEVRRQARQAAADLEAVAAALQADAGRVERMNEERRVAATPPPADAAGDPPAPPVAPPPVDRGAAADPAPPAA